MPNKSIMCIWHAVYAKSCNKQLTTSIDLDILKSVTYYVARAAEVQFSPALFDESFEGNTITFQLYVDYFRNDLVSRSNMSKCMANVETACWNMCVATFKPRTIYFTDDTKNLWQVKNYLTFIIKNCLHKYFIHLHTPTYFIHLHTHTYLIHLHTPTYAHACTLALFRFAKIKFHNFCLFD